jgi:hypothetical protein
LRNALPSQFEKAPNRPLYLRQVRQLLRAAGSSIDERSGFRGLLDLLHQAQREGWVRLHRDRKGVWRVFPAAVAPAPVAAIPAEIAAETPEILEAEFLPIETEVDWEIQEQSDEVPEPAPEPVMEAPAPEALPPPPAVAAEGVAEAPPERKPRRTRAAKAGTKTTTRKTSSRRKPKEPVAS